MLDMIERLLLEADLEDQLPKLEVIVTNIEGQLPKLEVIVTNSEDQLPKLEVIITNINIVNNIEDQLPKLEVSVNNTSYQCVIVINLINPKCVSCITTIMFLLILKLKYKNLGLWEDN